MIDRINSSNDLLNPLSIISFLLKLISNGEDISISLTKNVLHDYFCGKIFIKAEIKKLYSGFNLLS